MLVQEAIIITEDNDAVLAKSLRVLCGVVLYGLNSLGSDLSQAMSERSVSVADSTREAATAADAAPSSSITYAKDCSRCARCTSGVR